MTVVQTGKGCECGHCRELHHGDGDRCEICGCQKYRIPAVVKSPTGTRVGPTGNKFGQTEEAAKSDDGPRPKASLGRGEVPFDRDRGRNDKQPRP